MSLEKYHKEPLKLTKSVANTIGTISSLIGYRCQAYHSDNCASHGSAQPVDGRTFLGLRLAAAGQ